MIVFLFQFPTYGQINFSTGLVQPEKDYRVHAMSEKGTYTAVAGKDENGEEVLKAWENRTGKILYSFKKDYHSIEKILVSEKAGIIVFSLSSYNNNELRIVRINDLLTTDSIKLNQSLYKLEYIPSVHSLAFSTKRFLSSDAHPSLYVYEIATKRLKEKLSFPFADEVEFSISENGKDIALIAAETYGSKNKVVIKELDNLKDSVVIPELYGNNYSIRSLPGNKWLLAGWNPCGFYIIDKKEILAEVSLEAYEKLLDIDFDDTHVHLLVRNTASGNQSEILSYSLSDFSFVNSFTELPAHTALFSLQKDSLMVVANHDSVIFAGLHSYKPGYIPVSVQVQSNHSNSVDKIIVHPNKPLVASYGYDEKIKIWDLRAGLISDEINMNVEGMMFASDRDLLYFHDLSNIYIYDLITRRIIQTISKNIGSSYSGLTSVGFVDDKTGWIMHNSNDSLLYRLSLNGKTLVPSGRISEKIKDIIPLKKGNFVYNVWRSEDDVLNNYDFYSADVKGNKIAALKIINLSKYSVNKDKSAIAFIRTVDGENGEAWHYVVETYSLPSFKLLNRISLKENTVVPALDNDFRKISFVGQDYDKGDSLVIAAFPSLKEIRTVSSSEYFTAAELTWDGSNELVIVKNDYNYFSTAGNGFQSYKLPNIPPNQLQVDEKKKKLWISNDRGLWEYDLSTLESAKLRDSLDMGRLWTPASKQGIFYSSYKQGSYQFEAIDSSYKTVFRFPSNNRFYAIQPGAATWVAHGEENGQDMVQLSLFNNSGEEIRKDSVKGRFPLSFAPSSPTMVCLSSDQDAYWVYDLKTMKRRDDLTIKAQRYERQPAHFINHGQTLLYAPNGYTIHKLNLLSGSVEEIQLEDVSEIKSIQVSPNENYALLKSGIKSDFIYLLDLETNSLVRKFAVYETGFLQMHFADDSTVLTTNKDGSIGWHNIHTGRNFLITLFDAEGHVIHYDPSSRQYASSRKDPRGMAFVYKNKVVPFIQFDARLNRPANVLNTLSYTDGKLIELLHHATEKRLKLEGLHLHDEALDKIELPVVEIYDAAALPLITKERFVKFSVAASDSVSNINSFHVLVNGNPEFGIKGKLVKASNKIKETFEVELGRGMNKIEVYVTNEKGVESLKESFQVESEMVDEPGKIYFVGIGAAHYKEASMNLEYAAKDIRDMAAAIQNRYPGAVIDTLINADVTAVNLMQVKKRLMQTSIHDKVILSYAGHGLLSDSLDFYFATYGINFNKPQDGGWSYEQMESLLDGIPAREKLMLIDACHSGEVDKEEMRKDTLVQLPDGSQIREKNTRGGVLLSKGKKQGLQNSFELMKQMFASTNAGNGAVVISAAGGREFALESDQWNNGVFTYAFLNGLIKMQADGNADGKVSINEIKEYVRTTVSSLTRGRQTPTMRQENVMYDWEVW